METARLDRSDDKSLGCVASAFNDFGIRLLDALTGDDPQENVLLSPVSIALPFAMLLGGARGETAAGGLDLESLDRDCNALLAALRDLDPRIALAMANGLWVQKGVGLAEAFAQRLRDTYEAEITNLDFESLEASKVINSWVSDRTQGKIPQIMDGLEGSILLLANALWFKGLWSQSFDPAETEDGEFTRADGKRVPCRLMLRRNSFDWAEHSHFQALRLHYGNGRIAFYVFLPAPGVSCRETLRFLTGDWESPDVFFMEGKGEIRLPRFRAEWGSLLNDVLAGLGMGIAFQPRANFSGIGAGDLFISHVAHKVLLEVDEKGSEAAAATVVRMGWGGPMPFQMIVDRPFACAIRDDETGALLFAGWIAEPTAAGSDT